ncbi:hypothetical protein D3C73_778100 [compost metagenome]
MLYFTIYDSRSSPACFNVDHAAIVRSKTTVTVMVFHGGVCHPVVQNSPAITVIDRRCKWCFIILEVPRCDIVFFHSQFGRFDHKGIDGRTIGSEHGTIGNFGTRKIALKANLFILIFSTHHGICGTTIPISIRDTQSIKAHGFRYILQTQLQLLSSNKILFEYHTLVKSFAITIAIYVPHHIGRNRKASCGIHTTNF